ncbi:MAG: hypothetical protein K6T83_18275 [Alicyclobacillus sp.]|nr:hypothetical protein [Alicyclobacillus sp.]
MSEKRSVPTFRITLTGETECLEGPVVSPDRQMVADHFTTLHSILRSHGAVLVYHRQWVYLPLHAIRTVQRGQHRFMLPWPLTDADGDPA